MLFAISAPFAQSAPVSENKPRNIIFLVSDGMSSGVLPLAEAFSQQMRGKGTRWVALQKEPETVCGLQDTSSLNSLVTDSSAASSAWGSGSRINNGVVNQLPDGTHLTPIGKVFHDAGKAIGLVTTATVTHATPAGFAACVKNRNEESTIAEQYLGVVDVILGGGTAFFDPKQRQDQRDLLGEFSKDGYQIVRNREELLASGDQMRCLGLFTKGYLPYTIDQRGQQELQKNVPTLAEMTSIALQKLEKAPKGFLLQIEGARVDHAAHNNDIAAQLWDQLAFDDALGVALDFAKKHGDTLLIVTSDHGNANPGLRGMGKDYAESSQSFAKIGVAKESFYALQQWTANRLKQPEPLLAEEWAARMAEGRGLWPSRQEAATLLGLLQNIPAGDWNAQQANFCGILAQVEGNQTGIGWTGNNHTMDPTILNATGPSAQAFAGLVRNDDIFGKLCQASGITFQNPRAPVSK